MMRSILEKEYDFDELCEKLETLRERIEGAGASKPDSSHQV